MVDVICDFVKGLLINHCIDKIAEVFCSTHAHGGQIFDHVFFHILPQVAWDVGTRSGRTFLSLVFKSTANESHGYGLGIRRFVCQDKVLTACFPNNSWVRFVAGNVFTHGFPDVLEYSSGSSEVNACKIRVFENHISCSWAIHKYQVDHPIRDTGFLENLHQHLRRIDLGVGSLPYDGIAHQGCGCRQVAGNSSKVERSQGKYEALQRTLFQSIPYPWARNWRLLGIDFTHVLHIEAEEVNEFTGGINFCLEGILGLSEHGCRIDFGTVRTRD